MSVRELTLQPAWKSYFVFYAAIVIFGLGPVVNPEGPFNRDQGFVVASLVMAFVFLKRKVTRYRFSAGGVSKEIQWGRRTQIKKISLPDLASVAVRRGVVHRLIGVGHLQFRPRTAGAPDLWWYGVDRPFEVKRVIEAALGGRPAE